MKNLIAYISTYAQHIIDAGKKVAVGIDNGIACVCFKDMKHKWPYRIKIIEINGKACIEIETYMPFRLEGEGVFDRTRTIAAGAHKEIVIEDLFDNYFNQEQDFEHPEDAYRE